MLGFMEFFIGLPYFLWNQLRLSFRCRSSVFFWRVWKNSDIVSGRYFLCKDFTMATLSPNSQRKKNKIRKLMSYLLIQKHWNGLITYTILYLHNVFCLVSHTYRYSLTAHSLTLLHNIERKRLPNRLMLF